MKYDEVCLDQIRARLTAARQTVSVAESVTSGHLQAAFSSARDATLFYQGGITAYNAGQKTRHLAVEPIYANEHDCVSESVAIQMAFGCRQLFLSEYAIAITGYANKNGGLEITELFAFVAIVRKDEVLQVKKLQGEGQHTVGVQVDYTNQTLRLFSDLLRRVS